MKNNEVFGHSKMQNLYNIISLNYFYVLDLIAQMTAVRLVIFKRTSVDTTVSTKSSAWQKFYRNIFFKSKWSILKIFNVGRKTQNVWRAMWGMIFVPENLDMAVILEIWLQSWRKGCNLGEKAAILEIWLQSWRYGCNLGDKAAILEIWLQSWI